MNHIPLPEGLRQTITRSQVKGLSNSREDALRNTHVFEITYKYNIVISVYLKEKNPWLRVADIRTRILFRKYRIQNWLKQWRRKAEIRHLRLQIR